MPDGGARAVALDGRGADRGPEVIVAGARAAAADGIAVRVFGRADALAGLADVDGIEVIAADEEIRNDEEPVAAVRSKDGASVVMAARDVAEGASDALASAGSTGATMTAALFALRRQHGVRRPGPVRLPRRRLQRGGARGRAPARRVAFRWRGAEEGLAGGGRRPRGARRRWRARLRREPRGPRPARRRRRRHRHRRLHRQRGVEDDRGNRERRGGGRAGGGALPGGGGGRGG